MTFFITRPPDLKISPRPLTPLHPQQMVARRPDGDAARAGDVGGEHAADRGLPGLAARQRPEVHRLEGQHLAALGERRLDLGERRAGAGRHHHLARLVERDAAHRLGRDVGRRLHRPADLLLGAGARSPPAGSWPRCASASTRANSRSSMGRICEKYGHGCLTRPRAPPRGRRAGTPWPGSGATWGRTRS